MCYTFYYGPDGEITKFANLEYREGIYYGYKFYETKYFDAEGEAAKEEAYSNVLYPFGYGLSYTDFEWKLDNVKVNDTITDAGQSITIRVWVKNVGDVAGKDVVQVYVNPPYTKGGIEKAAANLMGFAKTKLLQPGESDVVTITFYAQDFPEGTVWPAGMSFNATTGILAGVPTGAPVEVTDAEGNKSTVEVTSVAGTFNADNWLNNLKVVFKFSFESDIQVNGENLTAGKTYNVKVGEAFNATVAAEQLTYGAQLNITNASNRRIMNSYLAEDGAWYHRDEDKSAADIVTMGDLAYDEAASRIYRVEIVGLPEGMKAEDVITMEMGWAERSAYEVNTSAKISGAATTAGTYEVTVNIYVPHVSKGTNPWMRAAGTTLMVYTETFTIVVE